jgi:hypothetical protein
MTPVRARQWWAPAGRAVKSRSAAVLAVLSLLLPGPALAWSELGHWLVGELAEQQLSSAARTEVRRLLAAEDDATLGDVAAWADALRRSDPPRFRETSRWHFINARSPGCKFDLARDCADGQCIVAAIETQRRILADAARPLAERRDALKFIVHLVGDIHQPLHASDRDDRGGNQFQVRLVRAPATDGRRNPRNSTTGTNLHSVWDSQVLAASGQGRRELAARLGAAMPKPTATSSSAAARGTPAPAAQANASVLTEALQWARETCELLDAEAIYPPTKEVDQDYLKAHLPLAERRIVQAAARLAALLEKTLAPVR